jgi:16S rRNA (uracil1498-N3)-methyltransferase
MKKFCLLWTCSKKKSIWMEFYYCPKPESGVLGEEESRHCVQVRRQKAGDIIYLLDGKGNTITAEIVTAKTSALTFKICSQKHEEEKTRLALAVAPVKSTDRLEWMVEKCTELGVSDFYFIKTNRTERKMVNLDRLEKIAIAAMKQSGQAYLPRLHTLQPLSSLLKQVEAKQKLVCLIPEQEVKYIPIDSSVETIMCIGPEGDFDPTEVNLILDSGYRPIALGTHRLRTETAAITAAATFMWECSK